MINGTGKLFNKRFETNNAKTMAGKFYDSAFALKSSNSPGLGQYTLPSVFGIYEDKNAKK